MNQRLSTSAVAPKTILHPTYSEDNQSVILSAKEFDYIVEQLEELEDIKSYDEAKKSNELSIPIDEAFTMIEANRKAEVIAYIM